MKRLYENPNAIYLPDKDKVIELDEEPTIVFSKYDIIEKGKPPQKEFFSSKGKPGEVWAHFDLYWNEAYKKYEGDANVRVPAPPHNRGDCSGRVFLNERVITFWKFPKTKREFMECMKEIDKKHGTDIAKHPEKWRVEEIGRASCRERV